ncbi:MAG: ATP-binding protein, partial [bacterium]|nr:ATP-binding protein [bacterium]
DGQTVDDEEVAPGSYVQITVRDSGAGIPGEVLAKVFEPFFTTKEIGKGSGLGLSMVYGFVKQSGGHVEIESEVGRGTTVRLYLPRADALSDLVGDAAPGERKLNGDESILVVEDDPDVRAFDVVILERLGYTVRSANDGLAALSMADAMPALDLLLTDVLLPGGMSGKVIADRVVKRSPGTKVLFVSGFSEPMVRSEHTSGEGAELLPKPYSKDDLARKVREVLDSDGGAPAISTGSEPT